MTLFMNIKALSCKITKQYKIELVCRLLKFIYLFTIVGKKAVNV